jgi:hypothetical protein
MSRCPATIRELHVHTHRLMEDIYEIAVEMGSDTVIYIPNFIKICSGIQNLIGGVRKHI